MKTVWKFPLEPVDRQNVPMPARAEILTVGPQGDAWCLWALVDDQAETEIRIICIHGTGHDAEPPGGALKYINTFQHGALVFHAFENVSAWP